RQEHLALYDLGHCDSGRGGDPLLYFLRGLPLLSGHGPERNVSWQADRGVPECHADPRLADRVLEPGGRGLHHHRGAVRGRPEPGRRVRPQNPYVRGAPWRIVNCYCPSRTCTSISASAAGLCPPSAASPWTSTRT